MKIAKSIQLGLGKNENIFIPLKLNEKKLAKMNSLKSDLDKIKYVLSMSGLKSKLAFQKPQASEDPLEDRKNHFLNLLRSRSNNSTFKKPISKDFHFGIEIECFIPYESLDVTESDCDNESECYECEGSGTLPVTHSNSGYETEVTCPFCDGNGTRIDEDSDNSSSEDRGIGALQDYLKNKAIKGLHVKSDSSIDPDGRHFAVEIACLTTDFKNLEKLCKALNDLEAKVNTSCGLHVHLDMRAQDNDILEIIESNLKKSLDVLFKVVPKSRTTSSYCKKQVSTEKYSAFNCGHLRSYGTIECRLHSGSIDFQKIKNWSLVLKSLVDRHTLVNRKIKNVSDLVNAFKIQDEQKNWLEMRFKKFNGVEMTESESLDSDYDSNEDSEAC